jgi:predicted transport protein
MADEKLLKKLQIKPGMRLLVLNAPDSFLQALTPLPEGATLDTVAAAPPYDYVLLFALNSAALNAEGPAALAVAKPDGLQWIAYPKKSSGVESDLSRDDSWQIMAAADRRPVTQIAIDDTWSALRFRPSGDETPTDLVNAQFAGPKAHLRPLYDRLIAAALAIDPTIQIAPRQSYVALQKNKTFALIKASTRDRLDLGLKLPAYDAADRLQDSAGFGSGSITHRVALHTLDDVDGELLAWLRAAYDTVT